MSMWLNVLKTGLPILSLVLSLCFTGFGLKEHGKATAGKYSLPQQALPVYGNIGVGIGLFVAGLGSFLVMRHRDVKSAAESPPAVPKEGVDPVIHSHVVRWMELATDSASKDEDLDWVNTQVKAWRNRWKEPKKQS